MRFAVYSAVKVEATVECPVYESFRVAQARGMFDLQDVSAKLRQTFSVELPDPDDMGQIGVIVGGSGSGKTTVARHAFGDALYDVAANPWPEAAVLDGFGADLDDTLVFDTLTSVGFGSPPSWLKPYRVLSNGEKFRCDLARALLGGKPVVPFDEFTSVVDRTVAKMGSAAVAKSIRAGRIKSRFVAVTCHYDVIEWLEPDWVLDMASRELVRGSVRPRPKIVLEVVRCPHEAWRYFAPHHYLDSSLHHGAQCYLALWGDEPVAFIAMLNTFGHTGYVAVSRLVTLPDYQGVGIGSRLRDAVCSLYHRQGKTVNISTNHPAMIRSCKHSSRWEFRGMKKSGNRKHGGDGKAGRDGHSADSRTSAGRGLVTFRFRG